MKQFQLAYQDDPSFLQELEAIRQWRGAHQACATVFRIYSDDLAPEHIRHVCDILDAEMPDALYLGCTTNANILNGALSAAKITLSCTIFERETTQVKLLQLPFTEENAKEDVRQLRAYCDAHPWVSAVELHVTMLGMSVREFCDEMGSLRSDIEVFGGGACNPNPDKLVSAVFSKGNGYSNQGIVFLLMGGPDFHTYSTYIAGWKPLKRKFKVTRACREVLYELDGEPAFRVYERFLNLKRGGQLISNTLEFPLLMEHHGIDVLRCPLGLNEDDSIVLATEVEENTDVHLAFGDPETILHSIRHDGQNIADFRPEAIQAFSCASRRAFWGDENVSDETTLFDSVAPTSGFYTAGEFLRIGGELCNFNITLVLIAMREGEPMGGEPVNLYDARLDNIESERIPLIRRFVSFIDASTAELEELNTRLAVASITDGLTGLYHRAEIERRIRTTLDAGTHPELSLIMLDIDNFKRINDMHGHRAGDQVIITLADILKRVMASVPTASIGRWGGEEFMILLPDTGAAGAAALAEEIRLAFATVAYEGMGCQTVSIGVIQARPGENADGLYGRVDMALYAAKANGKNQVVRPN